jgi:hypothetical protein
MLNNFSPTVAVPVQVQITPEILNNPFHKGYRPPLGSETAEHWTDSVPGLIVADRLVKSHRRLNEFLWSPSSLEGEQYAYNMAAKLLIGSASFGLFNRQGVAGPSMPSERRIGLLRLDRAEKDYPLDGKGVYELGQKAVYSLVEKFEDYKHLVEKKGIAKAANALNLIARDQARAALTLAAVPVADNIARGTLYSDSDIQHAVRSAADKLKLELHKTAKIMKEVPTVLALEYGNPGFPAGKLQQHLLTSPTVPEDIKLGFAAQFGLAS